MDVDVTPDPVYATHWMARRTSTARPPKPARPATQGSERAQMRRALRAMAAQRAEMDARWDAMRARYGIGMPQYVRPESFPKGKWELWAAEHPGAINVVAWRESRAGESATQAVPEPPAPAPIPAARQGELF